MKRRSARFISMILILALLVSAFSVLAYAQEADSETEAVDTVELVINRTYDEGWDFTNGVTANSSTMKGCKFFIDNEELDDFTYNYFLRFTSAVKEGGYIEIPLTAITPGTGGVIEYDLKTDQVANLGAVAYMLSTGTTDTRTFISNVRIDNNVIGLNMGNKYTVAYSNDDWVHFAFVVNADATYVTCVDCQETFDLDEYADCNAKRALENTEDIEGDTEETEACPCSKYNYYLDFKIYFGYSNSFDHTKAICADTLGEDEEIDPNNTYYTETKVAMKTAGMTPALSSLRIGFDSGTMTVNQGFCLDNLLYYVDSAPKDEDGNYAHMDIIDGIEERGYGSKVNTSANKPIDIISGKKGSGSNTFIMKVGSDYMLIDNERCPVFVNSETGKPYGAPQKINGIVYVPFEQILAYTGFPVFIHEDGVQYDISTESGSSILTLYRDTAIVNGERVDLYAAPVILQDPDNPENSYPAIAIEDFGKFFAGYYVSYDEMGLVGISTVPDLFDREKDLGYLLSLMKDFLYDFYTGQEFYDIVKEHTNDFDHPYLMADEETFGYMQDVYNDVIDNAVYKEWLIRSVDSAERYFNAYTTLPDRAKAANKSYWEKDEDYTLLAFELTNPFSGIKEGVVYTDNANYTYVSGPYYYEDGTEYYLPSTESMSLALRGEHYNGGYDYSGGRNGYPLTIANIIRTLALGYRISGEEKYAVLAYEMLISSSKMDHWSQGHFLTCGNTAGMLALAYDWLYDYWDEMDKSFYGSYWSNIEAVAQTIYEKTHYYAYLVSTGKHNTPEFADTSRFGGTTQYNKMAINWNAVCSAGILTAALAILGEAPKSGSLDSLIDFGVAEDGQNIVYWLLENNFYTLLTIGLDYYAPDGSNIESPGYWAYATNNLSYFVMSLYTATGDDLGMFELGGFDQTFYFAVQTEYPIYAGSNVKYRYWNYHDSSGDQQDTSTFFLAAQFLNDESLAALRLKHIQDGKGLSWYDVIAYRPEYNDLDINSIELDLDFKMQGVDGAVTRSSWEAGCTFMGVIGNRNNETAHGQIDSGTFVYTTKGYEWIIDLGSDQYDTYGYFNQGISGERYFYYRNSAEGHNLVVLTSNQEEMPHGQYFYDGGVLTDYYSEDAGMYAILDNSGAYGKLTNYARRGMLFTNNRQTAVIQDEIAFAGGVQSVVWTAHTKATVTLSSDKKTAFLYDNNVYIRLSIVTSGSSNYKFEVGNAGLAEEDFLLDATHRPGYSVGKGQLDEYSRVGIKRLMIKGSNTFRFDIAVVIEEVSGYETTAPVQYDYVAMENWKIDEEYTGKNSGVDSGEDSNVITSALIGDIKTYSDQAGRLVDAGYALTTRVTDFYQCLVRVNSAVNTYRPETFRPIANIWTAYESYLEYLDQYNVYKSGINAAAEETFAVASNLTGI